MPEPQSLEERYVALLAMLGRPAREAAARNLALAVLENYIAAVNAEAEAEVLRGRPLEGTHHRAMQREADRYRARIAALGTSDGD